MNGERKTLAIAALGESFSIGWVQGWTECLMKLPKYLNLTIQHDYATVVCFSRARIAEDMLKTRWDYILLVDDDNPPDPGRILQLVMDLELNPEIDLVAGWYSLDMGGELAMSCGRAFKVLRSTFQRRYPARPEDFLSAEAPDLQEIDWTGLGCVVMRRSVLEACGPAAFLPFQEGPEEHQHGPNHGWIWDDMHFCKVARAEGFRLFVDRRVRVPHLKLRDITLPAGEANREPAAPSMGTDCPGCKSDGLPVRDCLAHCSNCRAVIDSIDYVHTCRGGELCERCWKQAVPANENPASLAASPEGKA